MSRDAKIALDWADDTYQFRLAWGQLVELQEKCDAGPYVVLQRLMEGTWRMQDVAEPIRLGLIGGGMEPVKALKLVRDYVHGRPPVESLLHAQAILSAGVVGAPDELPKKKARKKSGSTTSPTVSSASPNSTEQPLQ